MALIYKITNKVNGRAYVGKTVRSLSLCWKYHVADARRGRTDMLICKAIRKYGSENFIIEVLEECDVLVLSDRETHWVAELGTYGNGYNSTKGGERTSGYKFNEESRQKMSEKAKARGISEETRSKIIAANTGKKQGLETLARRIGKKRGKCKGWSEEAKKAKSLQHTGRKHSEETKRKIAEGRRRAHETNRLLRFDG